MQSKDASNDLLAVGDAAAKLGVSVDTLRRWERGGRIAALRTPTGHRRFRRGDLEQLLVASAASGTRPAASTGGRGNVMGRSA